VTPVLRTNPFARARSPREIVDGVVLLGSERVNVHAVLTDHGITLIDCGFYGHRRYLDRWLGATGRSVDDIAAVVLTHLHADHTGFAPALAERGIPVYAPSADGPYTRVPPRRLRLMLWRPSALSLLAEAAADSVFLQPVPDVSTTRGYDDRAALDVPGGLVPLSTPGHSVGHHALHLPGSDLVFTGDALMTLDPFTGARGPLVFSEDPRRNHEALQGLAGFTGYEHCSFAPAHGEPVLGAGALGRALDDVRVA
jgi:glyoxylase-like metal-dependent hydrolase (beta-lactamase superfamily II)